MSTPVAVHLLPSEKVGNIAGRARARRAVALSAGRRRESSARVFALRKFPSPRGEGGSRLALLPAGASRVRGYFFALSATRPIACTTSRTNSSGCSNTIAFGIRNNRMPRVRK